MLTWMAGMARGEPACRRMGNLSRMGEAGETGEMEGKGREGGIIGTLLSKTSIQASLFCFLFFLFFLSFSSFSFFVNVLVD